MSNALRVKNGGTGKATLTAHGVLLGEGAAAVVATAVGTNAQMLLGATAADPAFQTMSGDATLGNTGVLTLASAAATVPKGGTGLATLTANSPLVGNGTGVVVMPTAGTNGQMFLGATAAAPAFQTMSGDATLGTTGALTLSECTVLADPGTGAAIPVTRSAICEITTAAAETNTLALPTFLGQKLTLVMDTRAVGNRVITVAQRINTAGNTIITLDTAGDAIQLVGIKIAGAFRWQVAFNDGATLT